MKPGVAPRIAAANAVGRVLRGGAWSNRVLAATAGDTEPRDARLARRLLYGVLRTLPRIDAALALYVKRGLEKTEPAVLDILRVAAHELLGGTGQAHAAVDTAVEATRETGHDGAAGFVNGVLRSLLRGGEASLDTWTPAQRHGAPEWFAEDVATLFPGEVEDFLAASDTDAKRTARFRPGVPPPPGATPTQIADVLTLPDGPLPDGAIIQDVASAAAVVALGPVAACRVLDVAAAPGGKTLQLWDGRPSLLVGVDAHERRLDRARSRLSALGYGGPWILGDGRSLPFPDQSFDRVLVDAPCSGLGTLRRRPELRYRVTRSEVQRLAGLQRRMLADALRVLAPEGRLVYSVCTATTAETIDVASEFGGGPAELGAGTALGSGTLLSPHRDGTDGMFISLFGN